MDGHQTCYICNQDFVFVVYYGYFRCYSKKKCFVEKTSVLLCFLFSSESFFFDHLNVIYSDPVWL